MIKVMFREHDHTVECIAWAPNSAYKSISEAFEEVGVVSVLRGIIDKCIIIEEERASRSIPGEWITRQHFETMGRGYWCLSLHLDWPRQLGARRVLASCWQISHLSL